MKQCITQAGATTAKWWQWDDGVWANVSNMQGAVARRPEPLEFPCVVKHRFGSRGTGNHFIESQRELDRFFRDHAQTNYIIEKFYSYTREYRLHVSANGCFYGIRKLLKQNTPEDERWRRHDDNSVWVVETNPSFDRPRNWDTIVADCVKALKALDLDVAAFDVKIQSATNGRGQRRDNPKFIILESNSAPSFGRLTLERYTNEIVRILRAKHEQGR